MNMKSILVIVAATLLAANSLGFAEDVTFGDVKLADAKGQQSSCKADFQRFDKSLVIQVSDRDLVSIPDANLEKLADEYTEETPHHFWGDHNGFFARGQARSVCMLTKSKSDWLYMAYYHEKDSNEVPRYSSWRKRDASQMANFDAATATHTAPPPGP